MGPRSDAMDYVHRDPMELVRWLAADIDEVERLERYRSMEPSNVLLQDSRMEYNRYIHGKLEALKSKEQMTAPRNIPTNNGYPTKQTRRNAWKNSNYPVTDETELRNRITLVRADDWVIGWKKDETYGGYVWGLQLWIVLRLERWLNQEIQSWFPTVSSLPRKRYCSLSQSTSAIIPHSMHKKEKRRFLSQISIMARSNGMTSCRAIKTAACTMNFSSVSGMGCLKRQGRRILLEKEIMMNLTCYDEECS